VIYIQGDVKPARRTANTQGRHRLKEIDKIFVRREEGKYGNATWAAKPERLPLATVIIPITRKVPHEAYP
jgi:hypothetical protein